MSGLITDQPQAEFMVAAFPSMPERTEFTELPPHLQLSPWFLGNVQAAAQDMRTLLRRSAAAPIAIDVNREDIYGAGDMSQSRWRAAPGSLLLGLRGLIRAAIVDGGAALVEESQEHADLHYDRTYLRLQEHANRASGFILDRLAVVQKNGSSFSIKRSVNIAKKLSWYDLNKLRSSRGENAD